MLLKIEIVSYDLTLLPGGNHLGGVRGEHTVMRSGLLWKTVHKVSGTAALVLLPGKQIHLCLPPTACLLSRGRKAFPWTSLCSLLQL